MAGYLDSGTYPWVEGHAVVANDVPKALHLY